MAKLGFANLTSLLFNFLTISNIIYNKQSSYDQLTFRNNWNAYYDYIIIGAGTSGSVLASRLTEDPDITVLLLEAGSSETVTSNTPGLSETLIGTVMDWKILSVPQNKSCLAMNGQQCHLASGRVIGGTSSINRMYYLRGNPADFDNWEKKFGLKSWSWKDIFPYMIRNENQKDPERAKSGYYGLNGPVSIEQINKSSTDLPENKIFDAFLAGSKYLGYRNIDLNIGVTNGSSILQSTIHNGKRQSMSSAFLEPNLKTRPNLHILANSVAMNILFENDRAIGVKFYRDWQQHSVFARQEVILSAGSLFSPKILQLSGIGHRQELNRLGIPVISDLPVGDNLHDHVGSLGLYFVANDLPESGITKQHVKQYFYYGKGPLAESRYAATVFPALVKQPTLLTSQNFHYYRRYSSSSSSFSNNLNNNSPDLMLLSYLNGLTNRELSAELTEQQINLKRSVWNTYYGEKLKSNSGKLQFTILPMVLKPESRGTVRLKSTNPLDAPLVDPNYFDDPDDLQQIVIAMREALRMIRTKPFEQYSTQWYQSAVPGCENEFRKFQIEFESMFNEQNINSWETSESMINNHLNEMKPILTLTEDSHPILDPQSSSSSTTKINSIAPSKPEHHSPSTIGYSNNIPFHFMSSIVSKLFRKATFKKQFQKTMENRRNPKQVSTNFTSFYYDQYWLENTNPDKILSNHPLMNKTIYGNNLVDGFSSSSNTATDQSSSGIITVWNNHSDRKRPKPPSLSLSSSSETKKSIVTTTESISDLLSGVSPIVLTGFFQSPPKPLVQSSQNSDIDQHHHHNYHQLHHHHSPQKQQEQKQQQHSNPTINHHDDVAGQSTSTSLPKLFNVKSTTANRLINDNHIDQYLKCMARTLTMPMGNYVGTCRMGVAGDRKRVVDERFRVVGVRGLRVVDCSVIPEITTGGMVPVAIMLGERGAEFIREDRKTNGKSNLNTRLSLKN